ncbi:MAG: SH3 domain-containing protein [Chloroflexi bacterium]|nr:SH3 domain-containing protein [Chloroflexota bacterium]
MTRKNIYPMVLLISIVLSACGGKATATAIAPIFTLTPDPCSSENLPVEVAKVNKLTREFDDYSALASNTPQSQLIQLIPEMQRVLRDAEDQSVPDCLTDLKNFQLAHMGMVVQTLMGFMNASDATAIEQVNTGIAQARKLHGQYDLEMARLLGITLVAPATLTSRPVTPEVNVATILPAVPSGFIVTNPGPTRVNLRSAPDLNALETGLIEVSAVMTALGRTVDNQWIQVQIPGQLGQTAWVYATLVQLSVPIDQLPVVTP